MLVMVSGTLRAAGAFLAAVGATLVSAPLHADPQHHLPRSLNRVPSL